MGNVMPSGADDQPSLLAWHAGDNCEPDLIGSWVPEEVAEGHHSQRVRGEHDEDVCLALSENDSPEGAAEGTRRVGLPPPTVVQGRPPAVMAPLAKHQAPCLAG